MTRHKDHTLDDDTQAKPEPVPAPEPVSEAPPREEGGLELAPPTAAEHELLRRERDELKDQVLRRRAEFENFRKRVDRDREIAITEAQANLLAGLLPTLDNLEQALAAPAEGESLREGVLLTYKNVLAFFEAQGGLAKDPTGEAFDPQQHQALLHEPVPGFQDGTIVEAFRKAYFFKDRLLRPALVKVAKGEDAE